jgi:hypothetical protein
VPPVIAWCFQQDYKYRFSCSNGLSPKCWHLSHIRTKLHGLTEKYKAVVTRPPRESNTQSNENGIIASSLCQIIINLNSIKFYIAVPRLIGTVSCIAACRNNSTFLHVRTDYFQFNFHISSPLQPRAEPHNSERRGNWVDTGSTCSLDYGRDILLWR